MSHRLIKGSLLVSILWALLSAEMVFGQPVAIVTDLVGTPASHASGKSMAVNILDNLEAGQAITLAEDAEITIVYLGSGIEYKYAGAASLLIGEDSPDSADGKPVQARELRALEETGLQPAADNLNQAALVFRKMQAAAGEIELIGPKNTRLLDAYPVFRWRPLDQQVSYEFALESSYGEIVFQTSLEQSELHLPVDLTLKQGRKYHWRLSASVDGKLYAGSAEFQLATESAIKMLESMRPAAGATFSERLIFALLLEQRGFIYAAQQSWQRLAQERPDDPSMQSILERL